MNFLPRKVCIAPMMDWTDRHFRAFMRCMTHHTWLYSEMVTTPALIHGDRDRLLQFNPEEHPVALQLGGCDPQELARCAQWAVDYGYDEVNLNVGCPSDRVQAARFGACLMKEPALVTDCVAAMKAAVSIPITVKTRIGVDDQDSYEALQGFVEQLQTVGLSTLIVHARKAWLKGLNPRQNREIPPLCYEVVYQLKRDFPSLEIILNGGVRTLQEIQTHLLAVDGVMIGRAAYQSPEFLLSLDSVVYGSKAPVLFAKQAVLDYIPYVVQQLHQGVPLRHMIKPLIGLFGGLPGARLWRQQLSLYAHRAEANERVILDALDKVS